MTSDDHFPEGVWTVITLKSGAQIETLLTLCSVLRHADGRGGISSVTLVAHPDSPTRIRELLADEIAAVHYKTKGTPDHD